jgi:purine-binding chemotaxis protein CheW
MTGRDEVPLLVFTLAGRRYAVPLGRTREIVRYRRPTPLPHVPPFLDGVVSVRGEVIPVVNLHARLGLGGAAPARAGRFVVVSAPGAGSAALHVGDLVGVLRPSSGELQPLGDPAPMIQARATGTEETWVIDVDAVLEWRGPR